MTLQDILDMLNQNGTAMSSPSGGGAASVSSSALGGLNPLGGIGGQLGGLLGGAFGGSQGGEAGLGSGVGSLLGGLTLGPLGALGGGFLGDFIGSLIGGGVPREAKTSAVGSALSNSGNPLADLVGQFVSKGADMGHVLSESGGSTFGNSAETLATFLQALTGSQIPTVTGSGFEHNPTFTPPGLGLSGSHFQLPQGYQFMDASNAGDAASVIEKIIGLTTQSTNTPGKSLQGDWQQVVQQLIGNGDLTKFQGTLGSPGNAPTSPGANPNVSLPHPLAQNRVQATPAPYPLEQGF